MGELLEFQRSDEPEEINLIVMPEREKTAQEKSLEPFLEMFDEIENFVILAHAKNGDLRFITCLDGDLPVVGFMDAFRAKCAEAMLQRLQGGVDPKQTA